MKNQFGKYVLVAGLALTTTLVASNTTISAILKHQKINYEGNVIVRIDKNDRAPKLAWRMIGSKTVTEGKWFSLKK